MFHSVLTVLIKIKIGFFGLLLLLTSCSDRKPSKNFSAEFLPRVQLAELKNKKLNEVSGLESSINNPKMLWTHNDSGNDAELFLLDLNLDIKLTCKLAGVENRDWEDIAIGPGPDPAKNYVYIADIGDNDAQYQFKYIYRFEEPKWDETQPNKITISKFDRITFQLPDKRKDTETLLIDSHTKDLYVVSKREEPVYLYELKFPYPIEDTLTANKLISLPLTQMVGGDFSSDGTKILMKNYKHIFYWEASSQKTIREILMSPIQEIAYEEEPQGEAIAWAQDGTGFYTLSEKNKGKKTYLYFYPWK